MYTPPAYDAPELSRQHELMREWSFALLICGATSEGAEKEMHPQAPLATHLPMLLSPGGAHGLGQLRSHMARANPQWRTLHDGAPVRIVFPGPQAFVSVNWYADGQTFPTWNYGAVHVTGRLTLEHDPTALRALLEDTIATYETPLGGPWRMEDVDPAKTERLLRMIVGFRIEIEEIEGKLKFSQDKSASDRHEIIRKLLAQPQSAPAGRFMQRLEEEAAAST